MKRANHDNEKSQSVGPNINIKQSTLLVGKRMPAIIRRNIDMCNYAFHNLYCKVTFFFNNQSRKQQNYCKKNVGNYYRASDMLSEMPKLLLVVGYDDVATIGVLI